METLTAFKTLAPDSPPAKITKTGVLPPPENLAPTEDNAVAESPFAPGDFVWAKAKGYPWWPALVSDPPDSAEKANRKRHSVLVAYFGEDTLAWCEPKQLKPFFQVFHEMVRQGSSKSFLCAVDHCMEEVGRYLELEITCCCVPVEARLMQMRRDTYRKLPVANYSLQEFLDCVENVARDVQAVNALEVVRLRSWVIAFGKVFQQGECWEFGRRLQIEALVDKIDLDDLPSELVNGKKEKVEGLVSGSEVVKGLGVITGKPQQVKRRRSMAKLIAEMDLDAVEVDNGDEEQILASKKHKNTRNAVVVKAEEEAGSSLGRRARKKSKYLSPPYTDLIPESISKSSEKTARKADPGKSGSSAIIQCINMEDENAKLLLKIERMAAQEIFSELVATAENTLHLKWNVTAKVVTGFFAMYRSSGYSSGAEFEDLQKLLCEFTENDDTLDKAGKPDRNGKKGNHEAYKNTDLDFVQQSSKKYGADQETELDCKKLKRAKQEDDLEFNQQKNDHSEKQNPRKKLSKYVTNQGALVNSDLCMADASDNGKVKQKFARKKMSKDTIGQGACIGLDLCNGDASGEGKMEQKPTSKKKTKNRTSHVALVSPGPQLADASNEAREKQNPAWKKKKSTDGICREALAHYDLHVADASDEGKLGQGRKRSKNDANGESAVNVALQMVNNFHEGFSEKKEWIGKDFANVANDLGLDVEAINCQKPVLVDEKKIERKEDAKLPERCKSGCKKNGNDPPKANSDRRKGNNGETRSQAALQLTLHSGFILPSIGDLIRTYSKYGALIENRIELFKESNSARVVFAKSADAENAYKDKAGPYRSIATYRLHYLPESLITKPNADPVSPSQPIPNVISPSKQLPNLNSAASKLPLPCIRKSLETMISSLACSSKVSNTGFSSDGLNPEARESLVGEMQGLLLKVEKMLNGAGSSSST